MRIILIALFLIYTGGCSNNNFDHWITFKDTFNIGSISMPEKPSEHVDTAKTGTFSLVSSVNAAALNNEKASPSKFYYNLYFATDLHEFDLFKMKQDSATVNKLFEHMINEAKKIADCEVIEKVYFNYPEPGVKITLLNSKTNTLGICRILIFDNYIIATSAVGTKNNFSNSLEDKFFNSLTISSANRNRK